MTKLVKPLADQRHGKFVLSPARGRPAVVSHGEVVEDQADVAFDLLVVYGQVAYFFWVWQALVVWPTTLMMWV